MGRLGDVLEALYQSPRDVQALHIRARQVADQDAIVRVHEWWNRQREAVDGSRSTLLITSSPGDDDEEDEGTRCELWLSGTARWREDSGPIVTIHDGAERLTYVPDIGGYRLSGGDEVGPPWTALLHSRWVASRCDIDVRGTDVVADRPCWWLELRPIPDPTHGIHNPFVMPPWLGTEHSCRVDQETGIVLAVEVASKARSARLGQRRCSNAPKPSTPVCSRSFRRMARDGGATSSFGWSRCAEPESTWRESTSTTNPS